MKWETIAKWVVVSLAILGLVWLGIRTFTVQESPAQPAPPKVEIEMKVDVDVSSPSVFPSLPGPVVVIPSSPVPHYIAERPANYYNSWATRGEIYSALSDAFPSISPNCLETNRATYSLSAKGIAYREDCTFDVWVYCWPNGRFVVSTAMPINGKEYLISMR